MKRLILALAMLVMVSPAWGGVYLDGNDLHLYCSDKADKLSEGVCYGYLNAMSDSSSGDNRGFDGIKFCTPELSNPRQLRDVVYKWLDDNPQHRHFAAASLVADALAEAWPCP
ncbi:MAG: hypothetical protein HOC63_14500 [Rhodospirillales bacterium]|jgi:hypothetical protein|nr:hypothetical protein [Rhodospirillales bacterium]MBT4627887.1 hypothetical protein [Rhodospirillales bacterium]MBT6110626.1 hypothetical protein [Rhodospirillales bacterium]